MKSRVKLEKYINFSLISNCIIFNTLAGCNKNKDKKGGKGCCGSGRDKETPVIIEECKNEQSAEELVKKQKEAEEKAEKEKKDKEEADKLAKNGAALNKERKDLLAKFNELEPRIKAINESEYADLVITSDITEEKINSASTTDIVNIKNKLNTLEQNITIKEAEINKRKEYTKEKNEELLTKFEYWNDLADLINTPEKYDLKVNKIISKEYISNSNYNQKEDITTKLNKFEEDVKQKFEEIKGKLKEDMKYINAKIEDNKNKNIKTLITTEYDENKFKKVEDCVLGGEKERENLANLNNLFNEISTNKKLIDLDPIAAKNYLLEELEKIKDAAEEFGIKYEDVEKSINKIKDNMSQAERNVIPFMLENFKIIKNEINKKLSEYNKNNKDIVDKINDGIQHLKLVKEEDNDYKFVVDHFFNIDLSFDSNTNNYEDLKETFKKAEKDTRDKFIEELKDKYNEKENEFKSEINNKLKLLKEVYSSQIYKNFKIDTKKTCEECGTALKKIIKNIYDSINSKVKDVKTAYYEQSKCVSDDLKKDLKDSFNIIIDLDFRTFDPMSTVETNFYLKHKSKEDIINNINELSKDLKNIGCYGNDYAFKALKKIKIDILDKYFKERDYLDYFIGEFKYKERKEKEHYKIDIGNVIYHDIYKEIKLDKDNLDEFKQEEGVLYHFDIKIVDKPSDINNLSSYKENNNIDKLSKIISFIKKIHKHNIKTLNSYVEKINKFIEYKKKIIEEGKIEGKDFEKNIADYQSKIKEECNILNFIEGDILENYNKFFEESIYWDFFEKIDGIRLNIKNEVSFKGSKILYFKYFYFYNFDFFKQFSDFYYSYYNDIKAICNEEKKIYDVSDNNLKKYLDSVLKGKTIRDFEGCFVYDFYSILDNLFYLFYIDDNKSFDVTRSFNVGKGFQVMGRLKTYFDKNKK